MFLFCLQIVAASFSGLTNMHLLNYSSCLKSSISCFPIVESYLVFTDQSPFPADIWKESILTKPDLLSFGRANVYSLTNQYSSFQDGHKPSFFMLLNQLQLVGQNDHPLQPTSEIKDDDKTGFFLSSGGRIYTVINPTYCSRFLKATGHIGKKDIDQTGFFRSGRRMYSLLRTHSFNYCLLDVIMSWITHPFCRSHLLRWLRASSGYLMSHFLQ